MNEHEIIEEWIKDSQLDPLKLGEEARKIPNLHAKYYEIYHNAKKKLIKYKIAYKKLKHDKEEFIINPTEEDLKRGWEVLDRKLLRSEIKPFLEGEDEVLKFELKMNLQIELVEMLQEIIRQINNRNFLITNIIKDRDFREGN